ncbi:sensor domain-containing protein [Kitasatospora xanthocidica]|uniref:sensor histidine kinase n=1 Tax=Kitasatospora xanthocidica TaxID=83382 RepID=UPI0036EA0828
MRAAGIAAAATVRSASRRFPSAAGYALRCLATGLGALVASALLLAVLALCLVGVGLLLLPRALQLLCRYADFHRRLVGRRLGSEVRTPHRDDLSRSRPSPLRDPAVRADLLRDLRWLLAHGTAGTALCAAGLTLCSHAVNWLTAPLWWRLLPGERDAIILLNVDSWPVAAAAAVGGVGYAALAVAVLPLLADLHARASRRLLAARSRESLAQRVHRLTASRSAALDAHAAELRRIERDLHDGAQADLVAVSLRLGMIRRALAHRPDHVAELVDSTQLVAEQALESLRALVRGIHPPVLADRGLTEAVRSLAAHCPVPTRTDLDEAAGPPPRAPAAAEAAAYFVIAEALTNVARHSGAATALVRLRITADAIAVRIEDDGRGGAAEGAGSGLPGLRRRVAAFDGTTDLSSPPGGPTVLEVDIPCAS